LNSFSRLPESPERHDRHNRQSARLMNGKGNRWPLHFLEIDGTRVYHGRSPTGESKMRPDVENISLNQPWQVITIADEQRWMDESAPVLQLSDEVRRLDVIIQRSGVILGRSRHCDICLEGSSLSRRHLRFDWLDGQWWVEDLTSENGSTLNPWRFKVKLLTPANCQPAGLASLPK
jgi:hypothetical protein